MLSYWGNDIHVISSTVKMTNCHQGCQSISFCSYLEKLTGAPSFITLEFDLFDLILVLPLQRQSPHQEQHECVFLLLISSNKWGSGYRTNYYFKCDMLTCGGFFFLFFFFFSVYLGSNKVKRNDNNFRAHSSESPPPWVLRAFGQIRESRLTAVLPLGFQPIPGID